MFRCLFVVLVLLGLAQRGDARSVSVGELQYNPVGGGDYEFVELINSGAIDYSLTGAQFTNGIEYTFPSTILQPGQRIVVCADRSKFAERYGTVAQLAAGKFKGSLKDEGEEITLVSALGEELFKFEFDSAGGWPSRANGLGSSLEVVDPNGDLSDPDNWRSSAEYNGSPGRAGIGPQRTVVINELLAHTDPPLEDAIELYNNLGIQVDISGWYISNSRANPMKFRIPSPTFIPGNGFKVFYEYQFNAPGDNNAFTFNSAHGDEAVVLSVDASGNPLLWMDATTFEASENGYSFARYPNGTGPLVTASDLSLGTAVRDYFPANFITEFRKGTGESNQPPRVGPLIFSRIQFLPPAGADEFLEIQNPTVGNVPLFDTAFPTNTWMIQDGVEFVFPPDIALAPGARLIVCATNPAAFRAHQNIPTDVQVFGPWTGLLDNDGERIALLKPDPPQGPQHPDFGFVPYILVEEIQYGAAAPWPVGTGAGFAIQRKTAKYGNDPLNWYINPGTPVTVSVASALVGSAVRLRFDVPTGYGANVESRRAADTGSWTILQSFPAQATARTQEWSYTVEGVQRVFRVGLIQAP